MGLTDEVLKPTADAIRAKNESSELIKPIEFATYISNLPKGNCDGSVDVEGLTILGYSADEIAWFQSQVYWNKEDNERYIISDYNRSLAGITLADVTSDIKNNIMIYPRSIFDGVSSLEYQYLYNSRSISMILLPNVTTLILSSYNGAFTSNYELKTIYCPDLVGDTAYRTFYGCYSLRIADLPNVTKIGQNAFQSCYSLEEINCPNATEIAGAGFYGCYSLKSIILPNITSFGQNALYNCYNLRVVDMSGVKSVPTNTTSGTTFGNTHPDFKILVPNALLADFLADETWVDYVDKFVGV